MIKAGALEIAYLNATLPSSVKNETSWNRIASATTCIECNAFSEFNTFSVVLARNPPSPGWINRKKTHKRRPLLKKLDVFTEMW